MTWSSDLVFAEDGAQALAEVEKRADQLSLILLDLILPDMHGLDILRTLKAEPRCAAIPVIIMTSDKDSEVESLTVKQKDLCMGYAYLWCASTPTISGSVEDADSGWSHREGGKQTSAYDKRLLRRMGLDLLAKYGIKPVKSTIHIAPGGMRVIPTRRRK